MKHVSIPPSKSQTMRAILFGALAKGTSRIQHYLPSPDTEHMIRACRLLGARVLIAEDSLEIEGIDGKVGTVEDIIDAGNSGIILRFVTAIAALSSSAVEVRGDHTLRPMGDLLDGLNQLGVSTTDRPIRVRGPLRGGRATLSGEDSQPVSALLIACSLAPGPTELTVTNPGETPWVNLTLNWLDRLELPYTNETFKTYRLEGDGCFDGFDYTVPGDWSSAAFPIASALLTHSPVTVENLDWSEPQGDREIVNVLKMMGAIIDLDEAAKCLHVRPGGTLKGVTIDVNPFIDAITILSVIACFAEGETRLLNAAVARKKECDRLRCLTTELRKMGAKIEELEDGLIIEGGRLQGASLRSYGDHRMAMSLAVATLGAQGESTIDDMKCAAKTFPNFEKVLG